MRSEAKKAPRLDVEKRTEEAAVACGAMRGKRRGGKGQLACVRREGWSGKGVRSETIWGNKNVDTGGGRLVGQQDFREGVTGGNATKLGTPLAIAQTRGRAQKECGAVRRKRGVCLERALREGGLGQLESASAMDRQLGSPTRAQRECRRETERSGAAQNRQNGCAEKET
ncbi:hypothetical protein ERJ75_000578200 [Trypanosoma vivax]|nr:hypothetical protein ERJ75_000578200 [Trypanosoma vivax]